MSHIKLKEAMAIADKLPGWDLTNYDHNGTSTRVVYKKNGNTLTRTTGGEWFVRVNGADGYSACTENFPTAAEALGDAVSQILASINLRTKVIQSLTGVEL